MSEPDQTLNARRIARRQESRINAIFSAITAKPLLQYQAAMLGLWIDNFESIARNYKKGIQAFCSAAEQQLKLSAPRGRLMLMRPNATRSLPGRGFCYIPGTSPNVIFVNFEKRATSVRHSRHA